MEIQKTALSARIQFACYPELKEQAEQQAAALKIDPPTFYRLVLAFATRPGAIGLLAQSVGSLVKDTTSSEEQ